MSRSDQKSLGTQDLANGAITNVVASDTQTMCNRSRMSDQKCLHIKMPCFALSLSSAAVLLVPLFFLFFPFFFGESYVHLYSFKNDRKDDLPLETSYAIDMDHRWIKWSCLVSRLYFHFLRQILFFLFAMRLLLSRNGAITADTSIQNFSSST